MNETIFFIEDSPDGVAMRQRPFRPRFSLEADTLDELRVAIRDAVACHFEEANRPHVIRLHFVREEVISI